MPTIRQKRVAKKIIENVSLDNPLTGGEMLEKVGYSEHLAKQPGRVLESAGVLEALNDYGFSEDNAKKVVGEILLDPKQKGDTRINAAKEVFKTHGTYAPEKSTHVNITINPTDPKAIALAQEYEDKLKETL